MKIWIGLALLLVACTSPSGKVTDSGAGNKIRIFYNNDNFAYLEPCGCRVSPIGGMDRRWNGMKAYPDESRLYVDAGNAIFKSTRATEFLAPQWYEQSIGVVEAMNLLGTDAATVGSTEFALGLKKFQEISKGARYPYISSNIYWRGGDKLFLPDSVVVEKYGKKIGIFALFDPALPLPPELEARDPVGHAKRMVEKLKGQGADMVLLLSHQGFEIDQELARSVKGIHLIVGANTQSLLQSPEMEGETLIVQLSNQGQMLGMVEYETANFPAKRTNFVVDELNAEYDNAPAGMANPMKALVSVTHLRMAEANRKLDAKIWAAHEGKADGFQTFLSCRECHGKQAQFQEGKRHAAAFLTLVAKKQEMNLDCVKCHSVGMGEKGGFRSLGDAFQDMHGQKIPLEEIRKLAGSVPAHGTNYRDNPAAIRPDVAKWIEAQKQAGVKKSFVSVQCENCHGPRPHHPFGEDAGSGKVLANACLQCHTKEQMPAWYDGAGKVKKAAVDAAVKTVACPR